MPPDLPGSEAPTLRRIAFKPTATQGLLQFIDDPQPGNIGGPAFSNKCTEWRPINDGFVVRQSNGFQVSFSNIVIKNLRVESGDVTTITSKGPLGGKITSASLKAGNGFVFQVKWNNGLTAEYAVSINDEGKLSGSTVGANNDQASLTGEGNWWKCTSNGMCEAYALEAMEISNSYFVLKCGPPTSRFSRDFKSHLNWSSALILKNLATPVF